MVNQSYKLNQDIKQVRRLMRKDEGMSSDIERIPLLSWLLFLKWLDDWDKKINCLRTIDSDTKFHQILEKPYRWRDWAANSEESTGDKLKSFVNKKLLPYLGNLECRHENDPRKLVSRIFEEINNPMRSEKLFREVINKLNTIDFNISEQIHSLAFIYEALLKELRDSAGNNGEFYTPRPVIRFIIDRVKPKVGELILDPAVGTGGFLVESLLYIKNSKKKKSTEVNEIFHKTLLGIEKKPVPYLLCLMNLILHGCSNPELLSSIVRRNALIHPLEEVESSIDVVMTNPPFGGEEESDIMNNFPPYGRTTETSTLFFQFIIKRLNYNGRCGIIVPNGFLFGDGVEKKVKEKLLKECNLHHIIVLPEGTFAPYTTIPTNILFFNKGQPTKMIHYLEVPKPEIGKQFSKTNPLRDDHFQVCKDLWNSNESNELSWHVSIEDIIKRNYDLSPENPAKLELLHKPKLNELLDEITSQLQFFGAKLALLKATIASPESEKWEFRIINTLLKEVSHKRKEQVVVDKKYPFLGISGEAKGIFSKLPSNGSEIRANHVYRVKAGDFIYNRLFAWKGSFSHVTNEFNNTYVSNEFPLFEPYDPTISVNYLSLYTSHPRFWAEVELLSRGSTPGSRNRFYQDKFLGLSIPVPKKIIRSDFEKKVLKILQLRDEFRLIQDRINELLENLPIQIVLEVFKNVPRQRSDE
ncbi:MAG: N-6 DNA methylase [Candidatus Hodarchaeota archaeon]